MKTKWKILIGLFVIVAVTVIVFTEEIKIKIIHILGAAENYKAEGDPNAMQPRFNDADVQREKILVNLVQLASGFTQPVDIQFSPVERDVALIAEKTGALKWINFKTKLSGTLAKINVLTNAEEGLLGVALSCSAIKRIAIVVVPDFRFRGSLNSGQDEPKTVGFENRSGRA